MALLIAALFAVVMVGGVSAATLAVDQTSTCTAGDAYYSAIMPAVFTFASATSEPRITDAYVEPVKVRPGDTMLVTAEVEDDYGISSVTADMGGIETIELELVEGTIYQGLWQKQWLVYDTELKDYITTITATNRLGLTATAEVEWTDPEIIIDSPANDTITDITPDLNFTTNESSNVTYNWDGEGNISGCRECDSYNTTYGEAVPEANTSLLLHFNENFGGYAYDDSSNNNDGTLVGGATWAPGKFGYGVKFDGVDDGINVSYDSSLDILDKDDDGSNLFTFGLWFKLDRNASDAAVNNVILSQQDGGGVGRTWLQVSASGDTIRSFLGGTGLAGSTLVVNNTWYFAVVTYNGSDLNMYVNGAYEASVAVTPSLIDENANGKYLFGRSKSETIHFNGTIDEVMFFNRELSSAEILDLYNKTLPAGQHNVTVYATDTAGNPNSTTMWFTVDTTPSGLADSAWPMFHQNLNHTGQSPYVGAQTNNVKWSYGTGDDVESSPAIGADGTVYVGSADNNVYALYPNGTKKWNYTTGGAVRSSPAIGADGTIYVGSWDNKVYAFYPNGSVKWSYATGQDVLSSPAIGADGTVYVGSWDGKTYAFYPNGSVKWSYDTGIYSVEPSPAIGADGTVYVGSSDFKVYAFYPNGSVKWSYATGSPVESSPAIGIDGTVYVGSADSEVYALYPNGTKKWSYATGGLVKSSPAIGADGTIYVGSRDGKVYAFYPNGTLKWSYTTGNWVESSPAIGADGTIYVGSYDNNVYALYPNGTVKWSYDTGLPVWSSPAIAADGTVYVGSDDNKLYAFGGPRTLTVCSSGCNYNSIQAAINAANAGDTIQVQNGTYTENVDVNKSVNLVGAGAGVTIVNAASSSDHVFNVTANSVNISGFTVTGATGSYKAGIYLNNSSYSKIENNNASNNDLGIYLDSAGNNAITNNNANSNGENGIWVVSSSNNLITNNNASSNSWEGIYLMSSSNNNTVSNNTASSNSDLGIYLYNSIGNTIANNTASSNGIGIYLWDSSNNTITNNNANSNNYDGIYFYSSSNYNTLTNNTANSNTDDGIYLYSSNDNTLTNNTVSNNDYGIVLTSSNDTTLVDNTASNNNIGIDISASVSNTIYNNLFNNTNNTGFFGTTTNSWNTTLTAGTNIIGGPYLGGNFWAKPDGTGFSETCADADSDGICDSSYNLTSGNIDYLPLAASVTDTTAPTYTWVSQPTSSTTGESVLVNISIIDNIAVDSANITVDGTTYPMTQSGSYWTYTINIPSSSTSSITYNISMNDTASNVNTTADTTITVTDNDAPTVTIDSPTNTTYTTSDLWINVTAWDNVEGSASTLNVTAELDGATNNSLTNISGNWNYLWTGIGDGPHYITIYANDSVGNMNDTEVIYFTVDTTAPTYSSLSVNSTEASATTLFSAYWQDAGGLSSYIFSWNNSGVWVNDSFAPMTGTGNWSNITKTLNSTVGIDIGWRIYANDSVDNWNDTGVQVLTTTTTTTPPLILFWDGGSIPANWTCISCSSGDPFYDKFLRGNASYGGTGGNAANNHTVAWVNSTGPSTTAVSTSSGEFIPSVTHTHNSLDSGSTSSNSTLPRYRSLKVIAYDNGIPSTIPAGAIAIFNDTLPTDWAAYTPQNGYFLVGNDSVTTGGSNANHTHSADFTTGSPSDAAVESESGSTAGSASNHTHSGSGTTASGSHVPLYINVTFANATTDTSVPVGLIGIFNGTPPSAWTSMSGPGGDFADKFVVGSVTYGATGGNPTHTHSDLTATTDAPSALDGGGSGSVDDFAASTHTHDITVSFNSKNNLPPYIDVVFAYAVSGVDTTPPTITLTSPTNTTYTSSSVDLNASASETIDAWWYSLDGGANVTFMPNTTLPGLSNGQHNITIWANDSAGNVGSTKVAVETWIKTYDGGNDDDARAIAVDSSGNVYVTGPSWSGNNKWRTIKYNSSGDVNWSKSYDGGGDDVSRGIAVDGSGNVYVAGGSYLGGNYDYHIIKYNYSGGVNWTKIYDNGSNDYAIGVAVDGSGNVYVTGWSTFGGNYDYYTIKYDSAGNVLWNATYDGGGRDIANGVAVDSSGNVYVTGYSNLSGDWDFHTIKYDSGGNELWNTTSDSGGKEDVALGVAVDNIGNVYVTGYSNLGGGDYGWYTVKYDSSGNELWNITYYDGVGENRALDVAVDSSDNVYVTGWFNFSGNLLDYYTIKYDSSGNVLWSKTYDTGGNDLSNGIAVDSSGYVYITGKASASKDFYTIKYSQETGPVYFTVNATISCGDTIYNDTTLTEDLTACSGYGLLIGADDITLDCAGYSIVGAPGTTGVYINGRNNVTARNCVIKTFDKGIVLSYSDNSTIINTTMTDSWGILGIGLEYSSYNTIANNSVSSKSVYGIAQFSSNYNTISDNTVANVTDRGIFITGNPPDGGGCSYSNITSNTVSNSGYGIYLSNEDNNRVAENYVYGSINYGIYLNSSWDNNITNNRFNNTANSYFNGTLYNNAWNTTKTAGANVIGGPYLGGNFWAKPDGTGFSEGCTDGDSDGICDSYYNLTSGNVDYLPLSLNFTVNATPTGLADSAWPMFRHNLNHTGQSPYVGAQTNNVKWSYTTGGAISYSSPAIGVDGTVYVGSNDWNVYAFYPNGSVKWNYTTGNNVVSSPAIGADGTVYVGSSDDKMYALYPNGTVKWNYTTGNPVRSSPAIGADGTIYVGSYDDNLYALYPNGTVKWNYTTGYWVYSSPAVGADGTVYVGSQDNNVYALYPNGSVKWSYTTGDKVYSSPAVGADGTVYVGSHDNNVYALYPNGSVKWSYTTGDWVKSSPAIGADGTVYVGSNDWNVYAFYPNGSVKWNYTTGGSIYFSSPAIASDGTVYVGSYDNNVYAFYPNGTVKWSYTTGDWVKSSPAIGADGTVYVGSDDGKLYAFGGSIDTTPPTITLTSPQNTTYTSSSIALDVSADESISTWLYSLNGAANVTFTPNTTITALEGSNWLVVYANDSAGNVGSAEVYFTVGVPDVPACGQDHTQGMVSYWKADGNATDSYDGNDGTLNGATFAAGQVGQAFSFDGVDDYVSIPYDSSQNFSADYTLEAWIKTDGSTDLMAIVGNWYTTGFTLYVRTIANGGVLRMNGGNGMVAADSNTAVIDGKWHHIAYVRSGSTGTFYLDGEDDGTMSNSIDSTDSGGPLLMAAWVNVPPNRFFNGSIDEVAIYNESLNASEIYQHYVNGLNSEQYCTPAAVSCTDDDVDGYAIEGGSCGGTDCDDTNSNINPGATELNDGVDNDCDGLVDEGFDTTPPVVTITSPINTTYDTNWVDLEYGIDENTSWIGYSLDGSANVSISGNVRLKDLANGAHGLTVYAKDPAGNLGQSEVYFTASPTYGVQVSVDKASQDVEKNENAVYIVTVKNTGNADDAFNLLVSSTSDFGGLSTPTVSDLASGASENVTLTVSDADIGSYSTGVMAISTLDATKYDSVAVTTSVIPAVDLSVDTTEQAVHKNENATYNLTIENTGTMAHTFDLSVVNTSDTATLSSYSVLLNPGESSGVVLTVNDSNNGIYYAMVKAVDSLDSSKQDSVTVKTTVTGDVVYGVSLVVDPKSQEVDVNENATYNLTVKNTGNAYDTYFLLVMNKFADVAVLDKYTVGLNSGESEGVKLNVSSIPGDYEVSVIAISNNDTSKHASVTTTTKVRSYYAVISAYPETATVYASENASYTITIENTGNVNDTFDLAIESSANATSLSPSSISLNASKSGSVELIVSDPDDGSYETNVTATSQGDDLESDYKVTITTNVVTTPVYGVDIMADKDTATVEKKDNATYTVTIRNIGNRDDNYTFTVESTAKNAYFDTATLKLAPGESISSALKVSDTKAGTYRTKVRATSQGNASKYDEIVVETEVVHPMELRITPRSRSVTQNQDATFRLRLKHTGTRGHNFSITISDPTIAALDTDSVVLNPGETGEFSLMVNTSTTGKHEVTINAEATDDTSISDSVTVRIIVLERPVYGTRLEADKEAETIRKGVNATFVLTLTNLGNQNDTFTISITDKPDALTASLSKYTVELGPSASAGIVLQAESDTVGEHAVKVKATSGNETDAHSTVEVDVKVLDPSTQCGGSYIKNSELWRSSICRWNIIDSTIKRSSINQSNITDSTIKRSRIIDSDVVDSKIKRSRVERSVITDSSIMASRVRNAIVINSVLKWVSVGSTVNKSVIINGSITINDVLFNISEPVNISDIVAGFTEEDQSLGGIENESVEVTGDSNISISMDVTGDFIGGELKVVRATIPPGGANSTNVGIYTDIEASDLLSNKTGMKTIKIYYTDINTSLINESTLVLKYYNESSMEWEELTDTGVNTTEKYVWANVTHFSVYGVDGRILSGAGGTIAPSGGGGGGGALPEPSVFKSAVTYVTSSLMREVIKDKKLESKEFKEADIALAAVLALTGDAMGAYPAPSYTKIDNTITTLEGDVYELAASLVTERYTSAKTVILTSGEDAAGSFAALAHAKANGYPILLSKYDALPNATLDALNELGTEKILLVGLPQEVEEQLSGFTVERFEGDTAYEVSVAFGDMYVSAYDPDIVAITDGEAPSAEAALVSILYDAPILLAKTTEIPQVVRDFILAHQKTKANKDVKFVVAGDKNIRDMMEALLEGNYEEIGEGFIYTTVNLTAPLAVEMQMIDDEFQPGDMKSYQGKVTNRQRKEMEVSISIVGRVADFVKVDRDKILLKPGQSDTFTAVATVPEDAAIGAYTGAISIRSEAHTENVPVVILVTIDQAKFSMEVKVLTKEVRVGDAMNFMVTIHNLGVNEVPIHVTYSLVKEKGGEVVASMEEDLRLSSTLNFKREFIVPKNISGGRYLLEAVAEYKDVRAVSTDYADISKPLPWMLIGLLLFGIIAASGGYALKQRKKKEAIAKARYVYPLDIETLPKGGASACHIGKLAENTAPAYVSTKQLLMHTLVAGGTGYGKSVGAMIIAEEVLQKKIPVIVFDPTLQWSGFLKPCKDADMLSKYTDFERNTDEAKGFKCGIIEIEDPNEAIDFKKYMNPGEMTIFGISRLDQKDLDLTIQNAIEAIFAEEWEETKELRCLLVFDEVHRLLPQYGGVKGYSSIERGVREFRKWGIGLLLISQVLSDFKGAVSGNIATEVQMNTRYEGDLTRVAQKYGENYSRTLVKSTVGVGMVQNAKFNKGRPYFVSLRPLLHSPQKISDEELNTYRDASSKIAAAEKVLEELKEKGVDTFNMELELNLAKDKLKQGQINMAKVYVDSLEKHIKRKGGSIE